MKITKENNEMVVRIPLTQKGEYTYGEGTWEQDNLVGIVVKPNKGSDDEEFYFAFTQYLDYKDDLQETAPAVYYYPKGDTFEKEVEEFEKICKELGIQTWYHERCIECRKVIYGASQWTEQGSVCMSCGHE